MNAYRQPLYYEIAFSFFDVRRQADLIERFAKKYSGRQVSTILDIACGPSLQLRELVGRGLMVALFTEGRSSCNGDIKG